MNPCKADKRVRGYTSWSNAVFAVFYHWIPILTALLCDKCDMPACEVHRAVKIALILCDKLVTRF